MASASVAKKRRAGEETEGGLTDPPSSAHVGPCLALPCLALPSRAVPDHAVPRDRRAIAHAKIRAIRPRTDLLKLIMLSISAGARLMARHWFAVTLGAIWLAVPYPLGLFLFVLGAGGHWTLQLAKDVVLRHRHPDVLEVRR